MDLRLDHERDWKSRKISRKAAKTPRKAKTENLRKSERFSEMALQRLRRITDYFTGHHNRQKESPLSRANFRNLHLCSSAVSPLFTGPSLKIVHFPKILLTCLFLASLRLCVRFFCFFRFPLVFQLPDSLTERTTCGDLVGSPNFFCSLSASSFTNVLPSADCV